MFHKRDGKGLTYITKEYQLRFITYFCGSLLAGTALSMGIFYMYTYKEMGAGYYQHLLTLQGLRHNIMPAMIFTGGIAVIFVTLVVLIITLIGSHRIAGPIYRLERSLESIGNGDFSIKTRFRKRDAIGVFADHIVCSADDHICSSCMKATSNINCTIDSLNARVISIGKTLSDLRREAENLKANPHQPPATLLEKINLIKRTVSNFKTD